MEVTLENFHSAFNARHLRPEQVAETFIYNNDFEELLQDNHTVLLGARGCGKTTLMKMLTLPALYAWEHEQAEYIRRKISFYSVYIPTDIYWNAQKDAYNQQLAKFPLYAVKVSKVAVTTNVLFSLCETFENIMNYFVRNYTEAKEIEFAKEIIESWSLPPTIPKLGLVKEALVKRTDLLNRHIQKTVFNKKSDNDISLEEEYFHLDYYPLVLAAVMAFERIFSLDVSKKWALCFDELELAPDWLQARLFQSLRSRDQKLLYKLSASPIVSISKDGLATPGNDLKLIKMWPHDGNNGYSSFSEDIIKSVLNKKFTSALKLEEVFGSNPIMKKDPDNYKVDGDIWMEIKELAETDEGLRDLLRKNGIDPHNPIVPDGIQEKLDTVLRKIKPIVYFRNYYGIHKTKTDRKKIRSRKAHTLFYGKELIIKICDGNPRWLIGIVSEILNRGVINNKIDEPISEAIQAEVLEEIAEQFFSVIETIPDAMVETPGKTFTLASVIKEIGEYFYHEIVVGKFQRDPHSTFIIDNRIEDSFVRMLEKGVYQGAIMLIDPSRAVFDFEMRGSRFRLSYLFSPKFKIPLRKYAPVPLSECLSGNKAIITNQPQIPFNQ